MMATVFGREGQTSVVASKKNYLARPRPNLSGLGRVVPMLVQIIKRFHWLNIAEKTILKPKSPTSEAMHPTKGSATLQIAHKRQYSVFNWLIKDSATPPNRHIFFGLLLSQLIRFGTALSQSLFGQTLGRVGSGRDYTGTDRKEKTTKPK
jgi:hypothetical protein